MKITYRHAKQIVALVLGGTLLLLGLPLLVLPGPGLPIMFLGLAVLASEFVWARHFLNKVKSQLEPVTRRSSSLWQRFRTHWAKRSPDAPPRP